MRRLVRFLGWTLPPLAFLAWAVWTITGHQAAAIPAFGPVDAHMATLRWGLLYKLGLGGVLLAGWTGAWTRLKASRAGARRPRASLRSSGKRRLAGL